VLRTLAVLAALMLAAEIADRYQGAEREAWLCLVSFSAGAFVAVRIERQRWRRAQYEYELARNAELNALAAAQVEQTARVAAIANRLNQERS
jgi:hypothetical protein